MPFFNFSYAPTRKNASRTLQKSDFIFTFAVENEGLGDIETHSRNEKANRLIEIGGNYSLVGDVFPDESINLY